MGNNILMNQYPYNPYMEYIYLHLLESDAFHVGKYTIVPWVLIMGYV